MNERSVTSDDFLTIGPRIRVMPIIHGSGDFAIQVREKLLARPYDCVAVPLPPSFQEEVEAAVERLPEVSVVVQVDAVECRVGRMVLVQPREVLVDEVRQGFGGIHLVESAPRAWPASCMWSPLP